MKKEEILRIVDEAVDSKIKSFSFNRELCETIRHFVELKVNNINDKENKQKDYDLMVNFIKTIKKIFKDIFVIRSYDRQLYELIFESRDGRSKCCFSITEEEFTDLIPFIPERY